MQWIRETLRSVKIVAFASEIVVLLFNIFNIINLIFIFILKSCILYLGVLNCNSVNLIGSLRGRYHEPGWLGKPS